MPKISGLPPYMGQLLGPELMPIVVQTSSGPVTYGANLNLLANFFGTAGAGGGDGGGGSGGPFLPLTGGIMQGPIVLFRSPSAPLEAATKAYVDAGLASLPITGFVHLGGDIMTGSLGNSGSFGNNQAPIDLRQATIGSGARSIWLGAGGSIALDPGGFRQIRYDPLSGNTILTINGIDVSYWNDQGDFTAASVFNQSAITLTLGLPGQTLVGRGLASAPVWTFPPAINAEDPRYGTVGNGIADDTVALQAAFDDLPGAGGIIQITRPHVISDTLRVPADTCIIGFGGELIASTAWAVPLSTDPVIDPGYCFLTNRNFNASSITDTDISILGLEIDWRPLETALGGNVAGGHAIRFRKASAVLVQDCTIYGGNSAVAFYGCSGTKVLVNDFEGQNGAAANHLEAPQDALVQGNTIRLLAGSGAVGIAFTATDAHAASGFNAQRCRAIVNDIFGPVGAGANAVQAAIQFKCGAAGCTMQNFLALGNTVDGQSSIRAAITVTDACSVGVISNNTTQNTANHAVISVAPGFGTPTEISTQTNIINSCTVVTDPAISISGNKCQVINNRVTGGSRAAQDIVVTGDDCIVAGNYTDAPGGFAASTVVTGNRCPVWGYDIDGTIDYGAGMTIAGASSPLGFFGSAGTVKASGWAAATGTATRSTFATSSVTLSTLAEHVKALIDDLRGYGLI